MISESKREYNRAYYLKNKQWILEQTKAYRLSHKDELREYSVRKYQETREKDLARHRNATPKERARRKIYQKKYWKQNSLRLKAQHKDWVERNRSHVYAKNRNYARNNREKVNQWCRKWKLKNPGKVTACDARRRARELQAKTDKQAVDTFFQWIKSQPFVTCTYCGRYVDTDKIHIDHIVPISRGGDHLPDNFALACKPCNSSKHDHLLSEWPGCPEKIRLLALSN